MEVGKEAGSRARGRRRSAKWQGSVIDLVAAAEGRALLPVTKLSLLLRSKKQRGRCGDTYKYRAAVGRLRTTALDAGRGLRGWWPRAHCGIRPKVICHG